MTLRYRSVGLSESEREMAQERDLLKQLLSETRDMVDHELIMNCPWRPPLTGVPAELRA